MPPHARGRMMNIWWWLSVPTTLVILGFVNLVRPSWRNMLGALLPLTCAFYITLVSSVVWLIAAAPMFIAGSMPRTARQSAMLVSAAALVFVAVEVFRG